MQPITNDTVLDFIRRLINMGGIDYLKEYPALKNAVIRTKDMGVKKKK